MCKNHLKKPFYVQLHSFIIEPPLNATRHCCVVLPKDDFPGSVQGSLGFLPSQVPQLLHRTPPRLAGALIRRRAQESNLGCRTSHVGLKNTQRINYSRDEICRKIFCNRSQCSIVSIATLSR